MTRGRGRGRRRGISHSPKGVPILPLVGVGAGIFGSYGAAAKNFNQSQNPLDKLTIFIDQVSQSYTGYSFVNNTFYWGNIQRGWIPLLLGAAGHKAANWLGVNRIMARYRIPIRL